MDSLGVLKLERDQFQKKVDALDVAIAALNGGVATSRRRKRGKMSASHKAKLAAAQKKRWARVRSEKKATKAATS